MTSRIRSQFLFVHGARCCPCEQCYTDLAIFSPLDNFPWINPPRRYHLPLPPKNYPEKITRWKIHHMENILIFLMFLDIRPFHKPACIFRLSALIMASYNALIISTTRLHTTLSLNGYLHKLLTLTGIMLRYCNANVSNHNGYFSTMTNYYKYLPLVFLEN